MALKRVHLIVRGRVQGVFYEATAQREARRLGLTGFVGSRRDGSLEMMVEGEEEELRELIAWSQRGPSAARVDGVDVRWRSYTGEYHDFRTTD
ncbi:MAG: acylphosphatase [Polyangiaceae bacterium]|jgi:acylphosphatase|nr:acylphosphatase [Polyangiaceae bacterium]